MRRALVTTLMAGALVVPAISASAQQNNGGVGIRLLEAPTARQNDPRALRSIVDHVKPGASFSRKFEVSNTTANRRTVAIYVGGADVAGGEFVPADGHTQNELSGWITVDTSSADLRPGQSVQPRLTISVPPSASAGERYAVVWAELPPATPPNGGIAVVNRVGLRVYLSVGPGGEPRTDFVIESLTAERDAQQHPLVRATIRNTGGRALDLSGQLWLTAGPSGLSAGPFNAELGTTLAIGAAEPVTVPLDQALPDGPWHAKIEMKSSTTVRSAEATITFPHGGPAAASPVTAHAISKSGNLLTYVLAGVGFLVLVLLLLLFLLLRRRREPVVVARPIDQVLDDLRTASGKQRVELLREAAAYGKDAIMASPVLPNLPVQTARDLGERVAKQAR